MLDDDFIRKSSILCLINLDPCKDYIEEDTYQRSTAFILPEDARTKKCDRPFLTYWYRFTSGAGGLIPSQCPKEYSCGMFMS